MFSKIPRFFIRNTFISNTRLKLAKNQAKVKQHSEAELWIIENCWLSSSRHHPKIIEDILKNVQQNNCVCLNKVIWLMTMKMRLKMKYRSHRCKINSPRPRHGHRYKCILCFGMMIVICIKQNLSNIWRSIHEKVKQHWVWVEIKSCLLKKRVICCFRFFR